MRAFPEIINILWPNERLCWAGCGPHVRCNGSQALTHLLRHLFHDVVGDVSDWCVAQALEEVAVMLQLHSADAPIINVRIQGADENQETQQQQR